MDLDTALLLAASDAQVERDDGVAWILAHADVTTPAIAALVRDGVSGRQDVWIDLLVRLGGPDAEDALQTAIDRDNPGERERAALALEALRAPPP